MRNTGKIIIKLLFILLFLIVTPFYKGIHNWIYNENFLENFVYHRKGIQERIAIKQQLNVMLHNQNITIDDKIEVETTQAIGNQSKEETSNQQQETTISTGKKVYIYNTHQSEAYADQKTVMDAAAILGNELKKKGIHVVFETADFLAVLKQKGWDYEESYRVSHSFLMDALVNYQGFDLIIDLHRDAIPREASYIDKDGIRYAKIMPVIGGLGKNKDAVQKTADQLTQLMNQKISGIMRNTMVREAYYNQEVHEKTILLECGGDVNTFDEVKASMQILADSIYELLMR